MALKRRVFGFSTVNFQCVKAEEGYGIRNLVFGGKSSQTLYAKREKYVKINLLLYANEEAFQNGKTCV